MKFVIAQKGNITIKKCQEWHTESFNEDVFGLFLDGNCVCFLQPNQSSFLDLLKKDEDQISSIEVTDDLILMQPKDAESEDYVRPTGDVY